MVAWTGCVCAEQKTERKNAVISKEKFLIFNCTRMPPLKKCRTHNHLETGHMEISVPICPNIFSTLLKESWRKVFQIAAPGLPFVVGARGLIEDVLNIGILQ